MPRILSSQAIERPVEETELLSLLCVLRSEEKACLQQREEKMVELFDGIHCRDSF
jgi:hypothetical protein